MTSRSERVEAAGGDLPPAGSATESVVAELTQALAATDRPPTDPGGAVEALGQYVVPGIDPAPATPQVPQEAKRGPGRPRKNEAAKAPASRPSRDAAPRGRRSLSDRLAESEAEAAALRAQVAQLRPDMAAVAQTRDALEGTFTMAGMLAGMMVHPTLDIQPQARQLAELWAVPLAPYMEGMAENLPWVVAGLGTVTILAPVYRNYAEATAEKPADVPMATPAPTSADAPGKLATPLPAVEVGTHANPAAGRAMTFPRPMGAHHEPAL